MPTRIHDTCPHCGGKKIKTADQCAECRKKSMYRTPQSGQGMTTFESTNLLPAVRRVIILAYQKAGEEERAMLRAANRDIDFGDL
jgi:hypothetical protein